MGPTLCGGESGMNMDELDIYEKIMGKSTIKSINMGVFLCDCFLRFDGTYIIGYRIIMGFNTI